MINQRPWNPLFIFSLPRSGSTLVQRILAASGQVSTSAEPWILLPHAYTLKSRGTASEYWHSRTVEAISDFYDGFPNGRKDYVDELGQFMLNLYEKKTISGHRYFLDKTPRYHLICKEIIDLFPEAKFIILWRNPLAVVSSILQSWCNGRWGINIYNIDIYEGLKNLLEAYQADRSRFYLLRYEQLIEDPLTETKRLFDYLDLRYEEPVTCNFKDVTFDGRMGDKSGIRKYDGISRDPLKEWENTFTNPFRRFWAKNYLEWIGKENLETMGYDYRKLVSALQDPKGKFEYPQMFGDLFRAVLLNGRNLLSPLFVHRKKNARYLYL